MDNLSLRIGNIIYNNSRGIFAIEDGEDIDNSEFYNPIQLTESILLQCGAIPYEWNHFNYDHFVIKGSIDIYLRVVSEIEVVVFTQSPCNKNDKNYICKVGSLHRLQNAYFILTNNELPININTLKI